MEKKNRTRLSKTRQFEMLMAALSTIIDFALKANSVKEKEQHSM